MVSAALKASTPTTTLRRSTVAATAAPSRPAVAAAAVSTPLRSNKLASTSISSSSSSRASSVRASAVKEPAVDFDALAEALDRASPLEIVDRALEQFGDGIAIAFSGAEDVALIEYAHLTGRPYRVFSLDTGRLNPETYRLFDAVEKHYGIKIEYTFPDAEETMALVREKGMFSFYEDGHTECCRVRKVKPLRRQLKTLRAWMTGQRKDQSPGTRQAVPVVQVDPVFEGVSGGPGSLVKFNPLSNVTSAEVWHFLRVMGVPVNELHSQGYVSIGCEPCTRAVLPNQHEREGRWWWEDAKAKECGLHSGNVVASAAEQAAAEKARQDARDLWADASSAVERLTRAQLETAASPSSSPSASTSDADEKATLVALYAPWCQYSQAMEEAYEQLAARYAGHPRVRVAAFRADEAEHRPFAERELGLETFPTLVMLPGRGKRAVRYASEARDVDSLEMFLRALGTTSE